MDKKLYAMMVPSDIFAEMRSFCDENRYRIADVIERMMSDWVSDFYPIDVGTYRSLKFNHGKKGQGRDTVRMTALLTIGLVDTFNDSRESRENSDLPFGDAIGGLWVEWKARYGRDFEPTPVITRKGFKINGRTVSQNPNDPHGKHRRAPKNYSEAERIKRATRINAVPIRENGLSNKLVIGWFEAFSAAKIKLTVANLTRFCKIQRETYGKVELPGEFLVWCVDSDNDPSRVELFSEWKSVHAPQTPKTDPLYWVLQDVNIPMAYRDEFLDYCKENVFGEIAAHDYITWYTSTKLDP